MKKIFFLPALLALFFGIASCTKDDDTAEELAANAAAAASTTTSTDDTEPESAKEEDDDPEVEDSYTVTIVYDGTTATVSIPSNLSETVTCTSGTGSNVEITNTNETDEVAYVLSGSSSDGSLVVDASYKMTLELNGLTLTSTTGAAINVKCGKRIAVILDEGTTNTLVDAAGGDQSGCLRTKGHFEFSGSGTLNVTGNAKHAIASKEYTMIKSSAGTINIVGAASDGIHAGQYFQMNGGTVNIDGNTLGDGIQAEYKTDDNDVVIEAEDNTAYAFITGGTLNITMAGSEDTKGIKAEGGVQITGGTFSINANSNGSRGIQTDGNMTISEDDATTTMTIAATGGLCTLDEDSDDPHRCMGIKVDGNLTINAGTVTVTNTGTKSRGIKVGGTYTLNGGTVSANVKNN